MADPKYGTNLAEKNKRSHKEVERERIERLNQQDDPDYFGYEDDSTSGRAAIEAYDKTPRSKDDYYRPKGADVMLSKSGVKNAQKAAKAVKEAEKMNPMGDTYKKGGKVSLASKRADGCAIKGKTKGRMV